MATQIQTQTLAYLSAHRGCDDRVRAFVADARQAAASGEADGRLLRPPRSPRSGGVDGLLLRSGRVAPIRMPRRRLARDGTGCALIWGMVRTIALALLALAALVAVGLPGLFGKVALVALVVASPSLYDGLRSVIASTLDDGISDVADLRTWHPAMLVCFAVCSAVAGAVGGFWGWVG